MKLDHYQKERLYQADFSLNERSRTKESKYNTANYHFLEYNSELICGSFVEKRKMNCFNCEMETDCKSCLDLIGQKKTYSTDNKMLKRKLANERYQMLPWFVGEYCSGQDTIHFESAKKNLVKTVETWLEVDDFRRHMLR